MCRTLPYTAILVAIHKFETGFIILAIMYKEKSNARVLTFSQKTNTSKYADGSIMRHP